MNITTFANYGRYDTETNFFVWGGERGKRAAENFQAHINDDCAIEAAEQQIIISTNEDVNFTEAFNPDWMESYMLRKQEQFLSSVQQAYELAGLDNAPQTYDALTATDFALNNFINIAMNTAIGRTVFASDASEIYSYQGGSHQNEDYLSLTIAQDAAFMVWIESTFDEKNIDKT